MSDSIRWKIYAFLAITGFGLALYLLNSIMKLASASGNSSSILLFSVAGAILFVAGIINSYTAYAFRFCRVDEVTGSRNSAVIVRSGKKIRTHARIQIVRNMDADNLSLTDDQRCVLFVADWKPWVCSVRGFKLIISEENSEI